jgi:phosphoglycolate phosphatase
VTGIEYKARRIPCRLIIFDKDGTLIDFKATWVPLIRRRVAFLLRALGRDGEFEAVLLRSWGIDPLSGKVDPRGPTPVASRPEEIINGTVALYQHGYPWDTSKEWVNQAFDQADAATDRREMLRPIEGIQPLLTFLKDGGFSLALATSDERKDTEAMLAALAMEGLFDSVICAGEVYPPKPDPETIFTICRRLSIPPQEAICIGDTLADMVMGKKAGVALTIGILEGGVTTKEDLEKVADLVVDSIRDLSFF